MTLRVTTTTSFGEAIYPPGATFGPRMMRDWEFVWMIDGTALYSDGATQTELPPGTVLLCRPGARASFVWDSEKRTRHAYAHFRVLQLPSRWPTPSRWPQQRALPEGDALRPLFSRLLSRAASTRENHFVAQECRLIVAQMLTLFVGGSLANDAQLSYGEAESAWPDAVQRAWKTLSQRAASGENSDLSLCELARESYATPEHLCRVFRAATGLSPMRAWKLARLDRALVLLSRSNFSVGEIAHLCGFASAFHFSRCFSETFGQSPRALRQALKNGQALPSLALRPQRDDESTRSGTSSS